MNVHVTKAPFRGGQFRPLTRRLCRPGSRDHPRQAAPPSHTNRPSHQPGTPLGPCLPPLPPPRTVNPAQPQALVQAARRAPHRAVRGPHLQGFPFCLLLRVTAAGGGVGARIVVVGSENSDPGA